MTAFRLEGIIPPILTPFDERGEIYEEGLRKLVDFCLPYVGGFYPCGSYGSGPLMEVSERKRVPQIVVDQVKGKVPVVIHVGSTSTRTAVALAQHAESIGADAVAAVPGYYYRLGEKDIILHYETLVKAVSIPVYAYNNPKLTGNPISPALLDRLAEVGVHGVKDSSFSIITFEQFMRTVKDPDFDYVIGTEALMLHAFVLGAHACISGLANAMPELMAEYYEAAKTFDMAKAVPLQAKVQHARDIMHIGASVPTAYAMLKIRGFDAGQPRMPFRPLDANKYAKVQAAMKEAGYI